MPFRIVPLQLDRFAVAGDRFITAALSLQRDWHDAAAAVDAHYGLKDRTVTALAFASQPAPSELQTIQMADALGHLNKIRPEAVVPLRVPRAWPVAQPASPQWQAGWPEPPRDRPPEPALALAPPRAWQAPPGMAQEPGT